MSPKLDWTIVEEPVGGFGLTIETLLSVTFAETFNLAPGTSGIEFSNCKVSVWLTSIPSDWANVIVNKYLPLWSTKEPISEEEPA